MYLRNWMISNFVVFWPRIFLSVKRILRQQFHNGSAISGGFRFLCKPLRDNSCFKESHVRTASHYNACMINTVLFVVNMQKTSRSNWKCWECRQTCYSLTTRCRLIKFWGIFNPEDVYTQFSYFHQIWNRKVWL